MTASACPTSQAADKAAADTQLQARRALLAEKLAAEAEAYQEELRGLAVTPEQRRAALEKRALDLFARREAERTEFAEEASYRAWRASNDELRTADSAAAHREVAAARLHQVDLKRHSAAVEAAKEAEFAALNERERQRKETRHAADVAALRARAAQDKRLRDEQLEDLQRRRCLSNAERVREVAAMKAAWAADDARADAAAAAVVAAAQERAELLARANEERLAAKADAKAAEKALDDAMFAATKRRGEEEEARERALAAAKRQSDAAYREALAASRHAAAESQAEWEAIVNAHSAALNAATDAAKRREDDARAALMAEVMATNDAQLARKAAQRSDAADEMRALRLAAEAGALRDAHEKRDASAAAAAAMVARRQEIDDQVAAREAVWRARRELEDAQDRANAEAAARHEAAMRVREAQGGRRGITRLDPAALPAAGVPRISGSQEPSPRTSFARKSQPWME